MKAIVAWVALVLLAAAGCATTTSGAGFAGYGIHATAAVTGNQLTVTVAGYLLTCQRAGKQANFPPATPA